MATFFKRFLHKVYEALVAYGAVHLPGDGIPPDPPPDERPEGLDRPPAAHPERLRPDVALTPVERALERELEAGS